MTDERSGRKHKNDGNTKKTDGQTFKLAILMQPISRSEKDQPIPRTDFLLNPILIVLIAITLMSCSPNAQAGLIITIPDVEVAPGGSGFLDVLIRSDDSNSFQNYLLDFIVVDDPGEPQAAAPIYFLESALPAPQLFDSRYVFFDNSLEADSPLGIDFVTDRPGNPVANDLITVIDGTLDSENRTLSLGDGNFLLARLHFQAPETATFGSVYQISLDFADFLNTDFSSQDFSSNIGSITINTAAVPEPSSFALMAIGSALLVARRRLGRDRNRTDPKQSDEDCFPPLA